MADNPITCLTMARFTKSAPLQLKEFPARKVAGQAGDGINSLTSIDS
jgi:hypothetical protein